MAQKRPRPRGPEPRAQAQGRRQGVVGGGGAARAMSHEPFIIDEFIDRSSNIPECGQFGYMVKWVMNSSYQMGLILFMSLRMSQGRQIHHRRLQRVGGHGLP